MFQRFQRKGGWNDNTSETSTMGRFRGFVFLKEEEGKEDRSLDNILASKGGCFGAPTCRNGHPSRTTRHPIYRIILILR